MGNRDPLTIDIFWATDKSEWKINFIGTISESKQTNMKYRMTVY